MYVTSATDREHIFRPDAMSNSRLPLPLALAVCLYLFFVGTASIKIVPIFSGLFDGLHVEIPWRSLRFICQHSN